MKSYQSMDPREQAVASTLHVSGNWKGSTVDETVFSRLGSPGITQHSSTQLRGNEPHKQTPSGGHFVVILCDLDLVNVPLNTIGIDCFGWQEKAWGPVRPLCEQAYSAAADNILKTFKKNPKELGVTQVVTVCNTISNSTAHAPLKEND